MIDLRRQILTSNVDLRAVRVSQAHFIAIHVFCTGCLLCLQVGVPANIEVWLAFCVFLVLASLLELALAHVLLGAVPAKLAHVWYDEDAPERDRKERTDSNGVVEMDDKSLTEMVSKFKCRIIYLIVYNCIALEKV